MKRLASSKTLMPIKALIPGLVGILMLTVERIIRRRFLQTEESDSAMKNSESASNWLLNSACEGIQSLGIMIFESYDNYFAFMNMMFLVHVFFHGFGNLRTLFTKENSVSFITGFRNFLLDQEFLKQRLRSLVGYSLIFCFYQIIWIGLGSSLSGYALPEVIKSPFDVQQLEMMLPSRILEQEGITSLMAVSSSSYDVNARKKPSLSIGKILGQVDIFAVSIQLSKDGKTVFATTIFPATLQIINISDPEDPIVISTFLLPRSSDFISKTIFVSPDETKLYISNTIDLQVIDIRNLKSPCLISHIQDSTLNKASGRYKISGFAKPNLILSRDQRFLFVAGYGLQVFDLSVLTAPVLIHSVLSQINEEAVIPASIALSDDGKTLYYSDGGLWIYNIEDPKNMKVLNSFNLTHPITSMILSNDAKTAFVLSQDKESQILLQKLDISEINSIKEGQIRGLNQSSTCQPIFLERSPDNLFMMILFMSEYPETWSEILIFDTEGEHLLSSKKLLVRYPFSVLFTDDYQRVLVGNSLGKLEIVDLYLDYPNKRVFSESKNTIQTFAAEFDFFSFSKNEEIIYSIRNDRLNPSKSLFGIHKVASKFSTISSFEVPESIIQMVISHKRAFLLSEKKLVVIDISNPENVKELGEYTMGEKKFRMNFLSLSQDGKTGFLIRSENRDSFLEILDLSNPQELITKGLIQIEEKAKLVTTILSNDEQTLFVIANKLLVYNVSDKSSPKLLTTLSFLSEERYFFETASSGILSPDGKSLFIRDESSSRNIQISLIDVSDISSPQIRSNFGFPIPEASPQYIAEKFFWVSADSKTLYIARPDSLLVVDVSNLHSPEYLGSIKVLDDSSKDYVVDFSISADGRKAYVKTRVGKLHIVSIDPVYSTFIRQDALMLGERYTLDLQALRMNGFMDYDHFEADYRFVKFALVEQHKIQNYVNFEKTVIKTAPLWMNFDLKTQTLSVEPHRKNDIGNYKVYFGFSTQIEMSAFSGINETLKSEDLVATLVALGYLSNQRFLTEDFGELKDFILPGEYSLIKEEVYRILKKYSFGTFNELRVIESLNLREEKSKFKINTTSLANLKVEISLEGEGQFLSRHYGSLAPIITRNKAQLVMEGSLKDLNLALREVVVNLPKDVISCDGLITVDDKLNPVRTESVKNISRYFNKNMPPGLRENFNLTIQNQVDREPLKTGQYFQIKLNPKTFFDKYTEVDNLNYQLVLVKGNNNETTALPSWLSFNDLTLMGTAPEEIFNRDFEFQLIVKNEFQEMKVPFTLHVNISSGFVLKLLMKYSPYILSIVGLLISANKIFNVICKGTYRHPKEFHVRIGEEITSEVIFPISFIREEIQEAKKILGIIERRIGLKNRSEFLSYFQVNEGERKLDKVKVLASIEESLSELPHQQRKDFRLYLRAREEGSYLWHLVNQIIINTLTKDLLKSSEEKETRQYFEEIKKEWPMLVVWDLRNSCFKINEEKYKGRISQKENHQEPGDMENGLLHKASINFDLLKDAILAYAFDCQNIDTLPVFAQVQVKERIQTNWIKRFLKLDLQECPLRENGKIGFGIGYTREENTLYFNGVVKKDMMEKTLVVQITDLRHKILKELWIFESYEDASWKNEAEVKGEGYEVF